MAVVRWDPWAELAAVQRDVQELFGRTSSPAARTASLVPPMDVRRSEDGLVVSLDLPGMTPDQVEVNYDRGVLTISGQRMTQSEGREEGWLRRERAVGAFSRSITLSEGIDPSAIQAAFEHGVLELRIPNAPQEKAHRIPITGAAAGAGQTVDVEGSTAGQVTASGEAGTNGSQASTHAESVTS